MKKIEVKDANPGIKTKNVKKITLELTKREAVLVLAWIGNAAYFHTRELQNPSWRTRHALKKGEIRMTELRQMYKDARSVYDKLSDALTGITADELEVLIEKFAEATK